MPTLTVTAASPIKITVDISSNTIREPAVTDLGDGLIVLELGGTEVSAVLIGRPDTIRALLTEATQAIDQL